MLGNILSKQFDVKSILTAFKTEDMSVYWKNQQKKIALFVF